jgi:protein-disulfide isomerase
MRQRIFVNINLVLLTLLLTATAVGQTPETVMASVNGREITVKEVDDSVAARIYPLQQQLYAVRKVALENLIISKLLETEAKARNISVEELRKQLMVGPINVTTAQVEEAYAQNASFFATMSPDEAKERLRLDLENQARMQYYKAALENLRARSKVTVLLTEPAGLSLDDGQSPAKGTKGSAVTIVEFSDFECPYCKQVQATLAQVLESYGERVRLVFKYLPLEGHRNSLPAARAAYCAAEQDRFWQYHDALFRAASLTPEGLNTIANELGLGQTKFQACIGSEQSRLAIVKDVEAARRLRIASTPSFVINGRVVSGALTFADFQQIIELELKLQSSNKSSSAN